MTQPRLKSIHAKRLRIAFCSTLAIAAALAYAIADGQHRHAEAASGATPAARHSGAAPTQAHGDDAGRAESFAGGRFAANGIALRPAVEGQRAYGPDDSHDDAHADAATSKGEDGLMVLAGYAQSQGANGADNSDNTPGHSQGGFGSPQGGPYGGEPGQASSNGDGPSGGGFGGGGGGAFGGGGVAGGDPGSGTPQHGGPLDPITNIDPGDGAGNRDGGHGAGGKICVVSAFDACGQAPSDGGPKWHVHPIAEALVVPPDGGPGGDTPPIGPVPEPSAWLMMILGFGGAGAELRARRKQGRAPIA